jgi:hypothetical protein
MSCNCTRFIDIWGRCLPVRNRKEWNRCKAKVDTVYWLMFNDYEIYNIIEETHIEDDRVIELV